MYISEREMYISREFIRRRRSENSPFDAESSPAKGH